MLADIILAVLAFACGMVFGVPLGIAISGRSLKSPMNERQVNTFTAGLMVIALLSLIVLTLCSGCEIVNPPAQNVIVQPPAQPKPQPNVVINPQPYYVTPRPYYVTPSPVYVPQPYPVYVPQPTPAPPPHHPQPQPNPHPHPSPDPSPHPQPHPEPSPHPQPQPAPQPSPHPSPSPSPPPHHH